MAELIITAMAQVHTAMTEPTPKPKPTLRSAMMKSWVLRTSAVLMMNDNISRNAPSPIMVANPSSGLKPLVTANTDLSIFGLAIGILFLSTN